MQDFIEVESPIDLRQTEDAAQWAAEAMIKRPWRTEFFDRFAQELAGAQRVLELGSGPGFLARHLLDALPQLRLDLYDFSEAMHALARERLGVQESRVRFRLGDFRQADWADDLPSFDAVITNQAAHEVRHKRHLPALHRQARSLLRPGAPYLLCDHFAGEGGMADDQLYATVEEQRAALREAGFGEADLLLQKGGLALFRAR
ncbi:class I SAM-dependent methyltransferase [Chromobacterium sp. IIBBL 290-4]|uniref:class I SAM-dependent methyltransferase n=1 Tax=Chromobacterium sp. IIBBL 290-4 TaxID=2953890 RepID=UPI0020B87561|nr:class I SAM-dependent methyltransferase [Chromobacterium sp. IIBBL 290-4]UTH75920.1 class I SAM-dependent methyltransferase [Chromobacterium sp. IIBBL 290-4]